MQIGTFSQVDSKKGIGYTGFVVNPWKFAAIAFACSTAVFAALFVWLILQRPPTPAGETASPFVATPTPTDVPPPLKQEQPPPEPKPEPPVTLIEAVVEASRVYPPPPDDTNYFQGRSHYNEFKDVTSVTLALNDISAPSDFLTFNVVFTTSYEGKERKKESDLVFIIIVFGTDEYKYRGDGKTEPLYMLVDGKRIEAAFSRYDEWHSEYGYRYEDGRLTEYVYFQMTTEQLLLLATAQQARAQYKGLEFTFGAKDLRSIQAFAAGMKPTP